MQFKQNPPCPFLQAWEDLAPFAPTTLRVGQSLRIAAPARNSLTSLYSNPPCPFLQAWEDLNLQPTVLETAALAVRATGLSRFPV